MSTAEKIQTLIDAQKIIMDARVETRLVNPIHDKLCRISDYLNSQASDVLKEIEAA